MAHHISEKDFQHRIDVYRERLAQELKSMRLAAGISRNELSARAGISRPSIVEIEEGKSNPTTLTLMRIVLALEQSCEKLFGEVENYSFENANTLEEDATPYKVNTLDDDLETALLKLRRKSLNNNLLRDTVLTLSKLQVLSPAQ